MQHWGVPVLQPSCSLAPSEIPGCAILLAEYDLWIDFESPCSLSYLCCSARKENCASAFSGAAYSSLLREAGSIFGNKECQCLTERALCYPASTRLLPRLLLIVLFFFILQHWGAAQVCQPILFPTENIICLLNILHVFLVQLTVKTEVDTSRILKNLYKTSWATA